MSVFTPCELPEYINLDILKLEIGAYISSMSKFYSSTNSILRIPPEFAEWCVSEATNGVLIGKGSGAMDIRTPYGDGIDVACLGMNSNGTNEKSIMQNFSKSGKNLDILFAEKKTAEALGLFVSDYYNKLTAVKTKHNLSNLYTLIFISTKTTIYIRCFKLDIDAISSVQADGITEAGKYIYIQRVLSILYTETLSYTSRRNDLNVVYYATVSAMQLLKFMRRNI